MQQVSQRMFDIDRDIARDAADSRRFAETAALRREKEDLLAMTLETPAKILPRGAARSNAAWTCGPRQSRALGRQPEARRQHRQEVPQPRLSFLDLIQEGKPA